MKLSYALLGVGAVLAQDAADPNNEVVDPKNLDTVLDADVKYWLTHVLATPENTKKTCVCDANECPYWTFAEGGFEDLRTCGNKTEAIREAIDLSIKFNKYAANDDIGQIMLQIEAVLRQQSGKSTGKDWSGECQYYANTENFCQDKDGKLGYYIQKYKEDNEDKYRRIPAEEAKELMPDNQDTIGACVCECYNDRVQQCKKNPDSSDLIDIKRFKNLKAMVMSLQPNKELVFGRFCYYGCWCLPNGQHNLAAGYGVPVDPIDEVCKEFALCYKCLDMDFDGECNPEKRSYRWGKLINDDNEVYGVVCRDPTDDGSIKRCKRYTCECDKILAVGLGTYWMSWNRSYHARWGGFDREASCLSGCEGGGCPPQDDCCGAYGSGSTDQLDLTVSRRPYGSSSLTAACCQDVFYYNKNTQQCCLQQDGTVTVTETGTCDGTDLGPDSIYDFDAEYYQRKK